MRNLVCFCCVSIPLPKFDRQNLTSRIIAISELTSGSLTLRNSSRNVKCYTVISLTKLIASHGFPRSAVTKEIEFDQRGLHSAPEFERAVDCRCQALVSKSETLDPSLLPNCNAIMKVTNEKKRISSFYSRNMNKIFQ